MTVLLTIVMYLLGMVAAAAGSRLAGRCATWCCALCGLPMWVVNGTAVSLCMVLPQLMLAFLAAGMGTTALAVGSAVAGAVTDLGLVFALSLLRRGGAVADRKEFLHKCALLAAACLVLLVFVRGGTLSYTGTGLLMLLFVIFVLDNIVCQYRFAYDEGVELISTQGGADAPAARTLADATRHDTMQFPAMSLFNSLKNLSGLLLGLAVLAAGSLLLVFSAVLMANRTGTIQAMWAATLISLGFCLPMLAEVFHHPFGSVWKKFAQRCRIYPEFSLPMQILNNAVLSVTLVLPVSSLMYRRRLPIGAQYRTYELPICLVLALILMLPTLLKKRFYRWQGAVCAALYVLYLLAVVLAPISAA